jgi:hypothetical protein
MLDDGQDLGAPDAILINGRAPYRYDSALVPDGLPYEIVGVEPGHICFFCQTFTCKFAAYQSIFIFI